MSSICPAVNQQTEQCDCHTRYTLCASNKLVETVKQKLQLGKESSKNTALQLHKGLFTRLPAHKLYLITGYSFLRTDDTTELLDEAARVAPCSRQLNGVDSTQALLKTFTWVDPPDENTFCMVPTVPPHHNQEQQLGRRVRENQPAIKIIPGMRIHFCNFCVQYSIYSSFLETWN